MKKKYFTFIIILVIVLTVIIAYFFQANKNKIVINTDNKKLTINDVISGRPVDNNRIWLKNTTSYTISLYKPDMLFGILILDKDVNKTREIAENDFMKIVGVSKKDACKLNLELYVSDQANKNLSGAIDYGLSFCPNSIAFPK